MTFYLGALIVDMIVISCHASSPHGLYKDHQSGIPFLLKKLDELSQVGCRRMVFVDGPAECIPEVLDERQIWWSSWPVDSIIQLLLQEVSDDVSTWWSDVVILQDWARTYTACRVGRWDAARAHFCTWLLSNCSWQVEDESRHGDNPLRTIAEPPCRPCSRINVLTNLSLGLRQTRTVASLRQMEAGFIRQLNITLLATTIHSGLTMCSG